ncbi:MAG: polysaccharide deacetylase family protein [Treponema sp.]|jgi:peptidoglycan/xylan/chitin deacetylase (PgdA/CDA1 family)|nr:polysaccharide deacetylase family protein [Treponema sp.]
MKSRTSVIIVMIFLLFSGSALHADVWFDGLDLSESSRLLFSAHSDGEGAPKQSALFLSMLKDRSLQQLTAFPENIDVLEGGRTIQIRNTFGVFRIPLSGGLPETIPGFPSFADGAPILGGRAESMVSSADGNWILFIEATSAAYGNLVLLDASTGTKTIISQHIERPGRSFPARWSPDSQVFVYSRSGKIYYYAIGNVPLDERYRAIGDGNINSVQWGQAGDFFYMKGSSVYRVRGTELFSRALYTNFLEIGTVTGTIPLEFDPNFDEFWISPDSQSLLLSKEKRSLFYFPLAKETTARDSSSSLPYLILPRSCSHLTVLWSNQGIVTVLVSIPEKDGFKISAYRVNLVSNNFGKDSRIFAQIEDPMGESASLSPDGTKALVWGKQGIFLYDYAAWKSENVVGKNPVLAAVWLDNNEYIAGDIFKIERVRVTNQRSLICLSSSEEAGYENGQERIFARIENSWFVTNGKNLWQPILNPELKPRSQVSIAYRVYLENQSTGPYENLPMIRNVSSVGTVSLFPGTSELYEKVDLNTNEIVDNSPESVFTHGRRNGLREVALAFDLIDDDRGLPQTLDALNRFGIKATFFLNGEFIRRHPGGAKNIVNAGHETASMFFAPIDLSDSRYQIDQNFLTRGLARNEDEFFSAAQAELSLLWHPPYYYASRDMIEAAASIGYRTIGRDVDPMDWVLRKDVRGAVLSQLTAADIVDQIMKAKKPGSIIPIRLGLLPGGRDDYLFNNLDLLLDALTKNGYSIVPVSTLIDHSR